jgi:hypothetical protein
MHFLENHEAYKEATKDLSHEEKKSFDNYLMGALWAECKPEAIKSCLKTAAICVADYVRPKS